MSKLFGIIMVTLLTLFGVSAQADTFTVDGRVCVIDSADITGVATASGELTLDAGYKPAGTTITQTANVIASLDSLVDPDCLDGTVSYTIVAGDSSVTGPITSSGSSVSGTTTFADGLSASVIVTSITTTPSNSAQLATWSVPYTVTINVVE